MHKYIDILYKAKFYLTNNLLYEPMEAVKHNINVVSGASHIFVKIELCVKGTPLKVNLMKDKVKQVVTHILY